MKIVIDARESGTSTGRYVDKLIEHLHQLPSKHQFIVLTKSHRLDFMSTAAPNFRVIKSDFKEFTFAEQLGLRRQIKSLKPDLVHFTMPQQPAFYSGKKVTTVHDLTTLRFNNPAKNPMSFKFKQQIYGWLIKRVARQSLKLIAISNFVKDDLARFTKVSPAKTEVIYEAADKISEPPLEVKDLVGQEFILFVGRPNPHKNLERLVLAMAEVTRQHPKLKLVLAGKTDANYRQLENFTAANNLTGQVYFTGFISEAQLRWLYEHALAYVFPSLSEGFGLPGLEAMNYSLPVLSSRATCLPEIYKDAALYFDALNVEDIASKIDKVIGDAALRAGLAQKGLALVKTYSWDKTAKQTLAVYDEVLTAGSPNHLPRAREN